MILSAIPVLRFTSSKKPLQNIEPAGIGKVALMRS
jgi:hypothetical protein